MAKCCSKLCYLISHAVTDLCPALTRACVLCQQMLPPTDRRCPWWLTCMHTTSDNCIVNMHNWWFSWHNNHICTHYSFLCISTQNEHSHLCAYMHTHAHTVTTHVYLLFPCWNEFFFNKQPDLWCLSMWCRVKLVNNNHIWVGEP